MEGTTANSGHDYTGNSDMVLSVKPRLEGKGYQRNWQKLWWMEWKTGKLKTNSSWFRNVGLEHIRCVPIPRLGKLAKVLG